MRHLCDSCCCYEATAEDGLCDSCSYELDMAEDALPVGVWIEGEELEYAF